MQHRSIPLAALAGTLAVSGSAFAQDRAYSDLKPFTAIHVSAGLNVEITNDDVFSVTAQASDSRALDHLQISSDNGVLTVTRDSNLIDFILEGGLVGAIFGNTQSATVFVSMPHLETVDASSGSDVQVGPFSSERLSASSSSGADLTLDGIEVGHLELSSSSGADLTATGTCDAVEASSSSGADLNGRGLSCTSGEVDASSGADLELNLSGSVSVSVSSGADVTIWGDPSVTNLDQSSGGNVRLRD